MAFEYVSTEEAMKRGGLRMIVVGNVPSLWGEAAKGILHIKRIPWAAVRLAYDDEPMKTWASGQRNGPIAFYDEEKPRSGWAEILLLAERIAPSPRLVPTDPTERAQLFGYAHEICGEGGLGWSRRLQLVHAGMQGAGGFQARVSAYLGKKYGYDGAEVGAAAGGRVIELLGMFAARLKAQRAAGSRYYLGSALTALDVYSAAALGMFRPLADDQCPMDPTTRTAFETLDASTKAALDPILIEHRDMMYAEHLALPLSL